MTEKEMVRAVMSSGEWLGLGDIGEAIQGQFARYFLATSLSARIRELRKEGVKIESRSRGRGLWQYRIFRVAPQIAGKQEKLFSTARLP